MLALVLLSRESYCAGSEAMDEGESADVDSLSDEQLRAELKKVRASPFVPFNPSWCFIYASVRRRMRCQALMVP